MRWILAHLFVNDFAFDQLDMLLVECTGFFRLLVFSTRPALARRVLHGGCGGPFGEGCGHEGVIQFYIGLVPKRPRTRPSTEDALAAIHAIRQAPEKYDLARDLAPFLNHKSNHVVAAGAATAERLEVAALAPDLVQAFERLMRDPAKLDQGCKATIAIVQALVMLEDAAARVFLAGIRHVQKEGSFGPPVDVAAPLRGLCARGLARMGHPDALLECVTLLADPEIPARAGAVRAIADSGRPDGVLLLRLKALTGDKEIEVTGECFTALLSMDPAGSVEFVAKFLNSKDEGIAEQAALALGESHLPAALAVLRDAWESGGTREHRRMLLTAIALLRGDEALEFLLERLREDSIPGAADALAALSFYLRDEKIGVTVHAAIAGRQDRDAFDNYLRERPR
jgi:HEAT repeat protein